jgi:hypothetical protein
VKKHLTACGNCEGGHRAGSRKRKAKDILWKSSIGKHMNSDVPLMTYEGNKQFILPKIDTDKISLLLRLSMVKKKKEAIEERAVEK